MTFYTVAAIALSSLAWFIFWWGVTVHIRKQRERDEAMRRHPSGRDLEQHVTEALHVANGDRDAPELRETPVYAAVCRRVAREAARDIDQDWKAINE